MRTEPDTSGASIPNDTFYGMLGDTERRWLKERGTVRVWRQGYVITVEGQPVENVMVMMHGLAAASCAIQSGNTVLLRLYGPGDIIGGDAVLGCPVNVETVQALARCSAVVISADQFADLHRSAGIARAFGTAMARRVRDADEQAKARLASPLIRLARILLEVAAQGGAEEADAITIPVDLSQETLAAWLAVSRATVARMLAELRQLGAISTGYRKITIYQLDQLQEIAGTQGIKAVRSSPEASPEVAPYVRQSPHQVRRENSSTDPTRAVAPSLTDARKNPARNPANRREISRVSLENLHHTSETSDRLEPHPINPVLAHRGGKIYRANAFLARPLTPRELEIAMLIAGGKRDKEIAAVLIISPATVARHSANLRVKLGVRTRAQVAAWIAKNAVYGARR